MPVVGWIASQQIVLQESKPTTLRMMYATPRALAKSAMGKLSDRFRANTDGSAHRPRPRLCAAALGDGFGAWVENVLGHLGLQVDDLLGLLGSYLPGAHLVSDNPLVRPANPSMGFGTANTTSSATFHIALGDPADTAGIVLG